MDNDKQGVGSTAAEQAEAAKLDIKDDEQIGTGYKDKTRRKSRFTTRQKVAGGGVAGLLIGGGIGFFTIISGPLQFIHFAQLLQRFHFSNNEEFMEGRTGRFVRHWRKTNLGAARRNVRLTRIGNKIADKVEIRLQDKTGLRTVYDNRSGNAVGLEILDQNKAVNFLIENDLDIGKGSEFDTFGTGEPGGKNVPPNWVGPNGETPGTVISFKGEDFGRRRTFLKSLAKGTSTSKVAGVVSARLLTKRAGVDWHPLNKVKRLDEDFNDFLRKIRQKNADEARNGTTPPGDIDINQDADNNEDGVNDTRTADEELARSAAREAQADAKANRGDSGKTRAKIKSKFAGPGGIISVAGFVGILCTVRELGKQVDQLQYANIILPMMRIGFRVVSTGNQVMSGNDVSMDELSALSRDFTKVYGEGNDKKTLSWASAKSIQAELGGADPKGPDIPPTAKPVRQNVASPIFNFADTVIGTIPGASGACTTVGQWALTIGEIALTASGIGGVILQAVKTAGGVAASALGVNPMDMMIEWIVNKLAGEEVDVNAQGPDLGNIANYGARLAANDHALAMGGSKLTTAQVVKLDSMSRESETEDLNQKGFFAKVLDIKQPSSVASKAFLETTAFASFNNFSKSTISNTFASAPNILKNLSSAFIPKSVAATNSYDYGFDEYGFSWEDQNNPIVQDPFENADIVENDIGLSTLNKEYGECFSTTIVPSGEENVRVVTGQAVNYLKLPDKCNSNDERLLRYRFYIADTLAAKSLACYEGIDDSACAELGFGSSPSRPSTNNNAPIKGLISHPNLGAPVQNDYYLLPDAPNGEYQWNGGTPPDSRYGSKALVDMIYTVAVRWYQKYPNNKLIIGDLNARSGHVSHKKGVDVDITTVASAAANTSGNEEMSKELGRMFADTGIIKVIFYNDEQVQADFNKYVADQALSGNMTYETNHEDHFHVRIADEYILVEGGQP